MYEIFQAPKAKLQSKNRDLLLPGDLGVWTGAAFLALYLDDGITRSLVGVEEAKLHALVVAYVHISVESESAETCYYAKKLC